MAALRRTCLGTARPGDGHGSARRPGPARQPDRVGFSSLDADPLEPAQWQRRKFARGALTGMSSGTPNQSGADRNANHTYDFTNNRVMVHWLNSSPLRASALRGLGSPQNTFANESFMDELAVAAGIDPAQFRLRYLSDPRAVAVIEAVVKNAAWPTRPTPSPAGLKSGRGLAYVRYDRTEAN